LFGHSAGNPAPASAASQLTVEVLQNQAAAVGVAVESLDIELNDGTARVRGAVSSQADREKLVLAVGNTPGVAQVDDQLTVIPPSAPQSADQSTVKTAEPLSTLYTVKKGDTLSAIAKAYYKHPGKYPRIFEANRCWEIQTKSIRLGCCASRRRHDSGAPRSERAALCIPLVRRYQYMLKTTILLGALTGLIMLIGGLLDGRGGVEIAFVFVLAMNFFSYWFSDKLALRAYRAQPIDAASTPELNSIVNELANEAGIPMPRLYLIDSETPNAFATRRNARHAAVAVTRGIMRICNREELKGVIGHELPGSGHSKSLLHMRTVTSNREPLLKESPERRGQSSHRSRSRG
jgi:LysM repeat protein